jgi:hypothetical protein
LRTIIEEISEAASQGDNGKFVRFVASAGRNFNASSKNSAGETLLFTMAGEGRKTVKEVAERTSLGLALSQGREDIVNAIKQANAYVGGLREKRLALPQPPFANPGQKQIAEWLISKGANVNEQNLQGQTALHKAVYSDNYGLVTLLLENGAIAEARDRQGQTPLHQAAIEGFADIANLLLKAGAYADTAEVNGFTPLHHAVYKGSFDVIQVLAEAGANPDAELPDGQTCIHLAANLEYIDIALYLITWTTKKASMDPVQDKNLDGTGIEELGDIVNLAEYNIDAAILALQNLMKRYPKSPQLWVSLFVFFKGEQNEMRQHCCEKAIFLDPGFYDGYRRLSRLTRNKTCKYYSPNAQESEQFLRMLAGFRDKSEIEKIEYATLHVQQLLMKNWNEQFEASVSLLVKAYNREIDMGRYNSSDLAAYRQEIISLSELPLELRPWIIIQEFFKTAS